MPLLDAAALGIFWQYFSNRLLKGGLAVIAGGIGMRCWVMLPLLLAGTTGALCLWL